MVTNQCFECEEVSVEDKYDLVNDMTTCRKQSDLIYSSHLETQGELQVFGTCNLVSGVEYEIFVFLISMHESLLDFDSKFSLYNQEYIDIHFHTEHEDEIVFKFCRHYVNDDSFILPSDVIQDANLIGKIEKDIFILPQRNVNENQVYDKGKKF